jgi:hypothetical protein
VQCFLSALFLDLEKKIHLKKKLIDDVDDEKKNVVQHLHLFFLFVIDDDYV